MDRNNVLAPVPTSTLSFSLDIPKNLSFTPLSAIRKHVPVPSVGVHDPAEVSSRHPHHDVCAVHAVKVSC
jgi:hypothetical protein